MEQSATEVTIAIEDRRWRMRGLDRNPTIGVLKVNVIVLNDRNDRFHVDTLDLCHARSRRVFLKDCGEELAVSEHELRSDLSRILLKLDQLQHEQLSNGQSEAKVVELTDAERSEAMELLKDENLFGSNPRRLRCLWDRWRTDWEADRLPGCYQSPVTKPLGVVIQSSSAAGKTSLMNAVLSLMPSESQFVCMP